MTISPSATQNSVPVASQWSQWSDYASQTQALTMEQPPRMGSGEPCVQFVTTTEAGKIEYLTLCIDEPIVIGRNRGSCSYIIRAGCVSNVHCKISVIQADDGRLIVSCEDVSTNGIFVNDFHIRRSAALIMDGDTIALPSSQSFVCHYLIIQPNPPKEHMFDDPAQRSSRSILVGDYTVLSHKLGSGSFAEVHLALDPSGRRQVACKTITLAERRTNDTPSDNYYERRRAEVKRVKAEVRILKSLKHPNINEVFASETSDGFLHIFLQLATGGDLFSYLISHRVTRARLNEGEAKYITFQLFNGLNYLHEKHVAHRDLKPENILLYTPGPYPRILIADFGLAKPHAVQETFNVCGTISYLPPEAIRALDNKDMGYIGMPADCWAAGLLIFVMLALETFMRSGHHPFDGDVASWWTYRNIWGEDSFYLENEPIFSQPQRCTLPVHSVDIATKNRILRSELEFRPIEVWTWMDGAKSLVQNLLMPDPLDRLTIKQAFRSPWIEADIAQLEELYHRRVIV